MALGGQLYELFTDAKADKMVDIISSVESFITDYDPEDVETLNAIYEQLTKCMKLMSVRYYTPRQIYYMDKKEEVKQKIDEESDSTEASEKYKLLTKKLGEMFDELTTEEIDELREKCKKINKKIKY